LSIDHRFMYSPGRSAAYRLLPEAKTNVGRLRGRLETVAVIERILERPSRPPTVHEAAQTALVVQLQEALIVSLGDQELLVARSLVKRALSRDPSASAWRALCVKVLRRRVLTTEWYGILESRRVSTIPNDLFLLLQVEGIMAKPIIDTSIALILLFRSLDAPSRSRAFSSFIAAVRRDAGLMAAPEAIVAVARLFFGHTAVDSLNPMLTPLRAAKHALASGRGWAEAVRAARRTSGNVRVHPR
jgi:hypothetical protein